MAGLHAQEVSGFRHCKLARGLLASKVLLYVVHLYVSAEKKSLGFHHIYLFGRVLANHDCECVNLSILDT